MDIEINWDKEAKNYQKVFDDWGSNAYNKKLMQFFVDELGLRPGIRVIDIGCGVGKYGTLFAALGCDVTLSDISGEMLRHAEKNMAPFSTPFTTLKCDFNEVSTEHPALKDGFQLSISTMSPAIHDEATISKMSAITDGFCFVSQFVDWKQPIRDEYYRLSGTGPRHIMDSDHLRQRQEEFVAAVKNAGYEPELRIEDYSWTDIRSPREAAARFSGEESGKEFERALDIVRELCDSDGNFVDTVNTKVAWIYWKCQRS